MSEPFLGQILTVSYNFAMRGWAACNGQLLPISQNTALFSLLGTTYGGNGQTTFALPNLQSRIVVHPGGIHSLGEVGGEATHTLTVAEMPAHTHATHAHSTADAANPTGAVWASTSQPEYGPPAGTAMATGSIGNAGSGVPHENEPPVLALTFIIALQGIFPSQN